MPFEELKAKLAHVWGSAPWENAEHTLAPVHEHIVRVLAPRRGMSFLDIATGAGAVARRAAHAGANVAACDFAPALVESARRLADDEELDIRFDVADAESLPYPDASFDAASSSMGFIFAPDHERAAAELARVTRPGGRVAFSAWREAFFKVVTAAYAPPQDPGQGDSLDWARPEYARQQLGASFELEFEAGEAPFTAASGEAGWQLLSTSVGPMKALAASLDDDRREQLHREFVEYLESFRGDGGIRGLGDYVLVIGTRR